MVSANTFVKKLVPSSEAATRLAYACWQQLPGSKQLLIENKTSRAHDTTSTRDTSFQYKISRLPQMPSKAPGPSSHVPLKNISAEGLLRSLEAEAEALSKIHVRIQKQLQNLEVEEKLLQHMIKRTRSRHSEQELQAFDAQYEQDRQQQAFQMQQQQQSQRLDPLQHVQEESQLQGLLRGHPWLSRHRQQFRQAAEQAAQPQQQLPQQPTPGQDMMQPQQQQQCAAAENL